ATAFALGTLAIAGLPPFGIFTSEFLLITSTFARHPFLVVVLVVGLLIAFGALILRLQQLVLGDPQGPKDPARASFVPLFLHLALICVAGLWLPEPVVHWFRLVAGELG